MSDQVGDENRECRPHRQRRGQHERGHTECDDRGIEIHREAAEAAEQRRRYGAEEADPELDRTERGKQSVTRQARRNAAQQAPDTQTADEERDDQRHDFDVDADQREQHALPHDLIQNRGETGHEKQGRQQKLDAAKAGKTGHLVGGGGGRLEQRVPHPVKHPSSTAPAWRAKPTQARPACPRSRSPRPSRAARRPPAYSSSRPSPSSPAASQWCAPSR
jgi:hypothetical protein